MIANTREIQEFKLIVRKILKIENSIYDPVDADINCGGFNMSILDEFRKYIHNENFLKEEVRKIDIEELKQNPYLRDIKIPHVKVGKFCLSNNRIINPGEILFSNVKMRVNDIVPYRSLCYAPEQLRLPSITEIGTAISWMTVEPFEINTFASFVKSAKDNVLLGGCGLGYIAYILSLKDSVRKITIVYNNKEIIELFRKYILPQFKNRDKIIIVEDDILEYMRNNDLSEFDEINLDVWREYVDMIYTYLPALEIDFSHPNIKFSYWVEDSLRYAIGKSLMRVFSDIFDESNIFDVMARDILENSIIKIPNDFKELVKLEDMRRILYHWYLDNKELTSKFEERDMKNIDLFVKKSREFISGK